jgi:23S rRNA (cytosine1962-C5)-methyltransferase
LDIFRGNPGHAELSAGDIADVYSSAGQFLARGYFHPTNSIAGRILSFTDEDINTVIKAKIEGAYNLRKSVIRADTSCYRVINSEADGLPGLVVDRYSDVFVIQINTCGMDKLKDLILKTILEVFSCSVYEKSVSSAREMDGLAPIQGYLAGEPVDEVLVEENGVQFFVSITEGQKTGLFLDHRR